MSLDYTLRISTSANDGKDIGVTTGNFYLRRDPFSSNTYTGNHIGNGNWDFGTIEDDNYELWTTSKQAFYGRRYLSDKNPTFDTINVLGAVSITGSLTVTGQTNFYNSFNINGNDLAHARNIQVNSLSENVGGAGVRFDNRIQWSDAIRQESNVPGLSSNNTFTGSNTLTGQTTFVTIPTYSGSAQVPNAGLLYFSFAKTVFGQLGFGNNWTAVNNFSQYPLFNGSGSVTLPKQFTTKEYVDNAVLTANFGSITSAFVNQVSTNVIRLLANGTNSTSQKVATSWALAMKQAKDSITASSYSATKQMIIQIEGVGESSTYLQILNTEIGTYLYPNVHTKGIHQSVTLSIEDDAYNSGTDASKCIFENVTITRKDLSTGTPSFSNVTFINCFFDFEVGELYFTNCNFRGINVVKQTGNLYFTTCLGTAVYTNVVPVESGSVPQIIVSSNL